MAGGRRAAIKVYLGLLLWLSLFHPVLLFAGHGVEDSVDNLPVDRVKQLMDAGEKLILIDMRPAKEFQQSRLPGARSLPFAELANRFGEVPKAGASCFTATASPMTLPIAPCSLSIVAIATSSLCRRDIKVGQTWLSDRDQPAMKGQFVRSEP